MHDAVDQQGYPVKPAVGQHCAHYEACQTGCCAGPQASPLSSASAWKELKLLPFAAWLVPGSSPLGLELAHHTQNHAAAAAAAEKVADDTGLFPAAAPFEAAAAAAAAAADAVVCLRMQQDADSQTETPGYVEQPAASDESVQLDD